MFEKLLLLLNWKKTRNIYRGTWPCIYLALQPRYLEKLIFFLVILVTKNVKIKLADFFSFKVYQCLYPRKSVLKVNRENPKFATFYFLENNISPWKRNYELNFSSAPPLILFLLVIIMNLKVPRLLMIFLVDHVIFFPFIFLLKQKLIFESTRKQITNLSR